MKMQSSAVAARRRTRPRSGRRSRRGALALELVLVLPILMIVILALIQFGLFFENMQQVSLACRVGAEEASQTPNLPTTDGAPIPDNIIEAVQNQLRSSRIYECRIRLEHNLTEGGDIVTLVYPPEGACDLGPSCQLGNPGVSRPYTRLSICVPMAGLMPNCLKVFCFDVSDPSRLVGCSNTFRYELPLSESTE